MTTEVPARVGFNDQYWQSLDMIKKRSPKRLTQAHVYRFWTQLAQGTLVLEAIANSMKTSRHGSPQTYKRLAKFHSRMKAGEFERGRPVIADWGVKYSDQMIAAWLSWERRFDTESPRVKSGTGNEDGGSDLTRRLWAELETVAEQLSLEASGGVPLAHALGFPWRYGRDYNSALRLGRNGCSLAVEDESMVPLLKENLPDERLWNHFAAWKEAVMQFVSSLDAVVVEGKTISEVPSSEWIVGDPEAGAVGMTEFFVKAAVLDSGEKTCGLRQANHELRVEHHGRHSADALMFYRDSSDFVPLAYDPVSSSLEELKRTHTDLVRRLSKTDSMANLKLAHEGLVSATAALLRRAREISSGAAFLGRLTRSPN